MKCLKTVGLAAVAAMALVAFIGASSASATVLCKEAGTTTNCSANGKDYPAGTEFHLSQESGTSLILRTTGGFTEKTCIDSTTKGSTQNTGSSTNTVQITVTVSAFGGCSNTVDTLELGELEVHHIAGTDNGTVTARGFKWTTTLAGISCVYGYGEGGDFGTLTGGNPATIDYNAVVPKREGGFACPSTTILEGRYIVTSPVPLYVSER